MGQKIPVIAGAKRIGITDKTLRTWIREGKITGYRVGTKLLMVDIDEVDQLAHPVPVKID
jgi:excisionase family DNA binding protein